jgi:hypothetical protein
MSKGQSPKAKVQRPRSRVWGLKSEVGGRSGVGPRCPAEWFGATGASKNGRGLPQSKAVSGGHGCAGRGPRAQSRSRARPCPPRFGLHLAGGAGRIAGRDREESAPGDQAQDMPHARRPYLHDGSAATVRDVLTTRDPQDRHGKTSDLSEQEINETFAPICCRCEALFRTTRPG